MGYKHFNRIDRIELSILLKKGYSLRVIAKAIKKSPSSVSREIKRNKVSGQYNPFKANHKAYVRRWKTKSIGIKIRSCSELERFVIKGLESYWSPEQIAGRWNKYYSQRYDGIRIHYESIYKWLYSSYGQRYCRYLLTNRYSRYHRRHNKKSTSRFLIKNRISISKRPKIINERNRFGDWEGDTVGYPRSGKQTATVLLERQTRFLVVNKINRLGLAIEGFKRSFKPVQALKGVESLTLDNGVENQRYQELKIKQTFFCNPYSAWEKGSVENAIKQLRQFIPKGKRFENYSQKRINGIVEIINSRPRKCLNWDTPKEIFFKNLTKT